MKTFKEQSEEEIGVILKERFGEEDIEPDPKVGEKKADFRVISLDTYIEVHAIKNIAEDQLRFTNYGNNVTTFELRDDGNQEGQRKILDRIANKLLHECTQLPDNEKNLIVTKTEGFFVDAYDVIDTIIGQPNLLVNRETMQTTVENGEDYFRTEEELHQVLQKISAIIAYDRICEHGKLHGMIGNNKENAKVPFDAETFAIFHEFLCDKCT